ncbi:TPA: hypothetical protein ACH3X1_004322 [Trebouxia sp. C0004]
MQVTYKGKWLEERAKRILLETELKQVREEGAAMRLERDKSMTAEAEYIAKAKVLEASNYENKQMIRDHASRVEDFCKQVNAGAVVEGAVKRAVEEFGKLLLSQTGSLLEDKLMTFGNVVNQVLHNSQVAETMCLSVPATETEQAESSKKVLLIDIRFCSLLHPRKSCVFVCCSASARMKTV